MRFPNRDFDPDRKGLVPKPPDTITLRVLTSNGWVAIAALIAEPTAAHASSHENGGADEIDVTGLSGVLADPQTAAAHTHPWVDITGEPTTLAGYGITDAASDAELAAHEADTTNVHGIADTSLLLTSVSRTIGVVFDGGGSSPTVGSVGYIVCQHAGTIDRWNIVADQSGSAVVDVWKAAGTIPVNADSIAGTEKPTLTAQQLNSDTSLSTWTTAVAVGDVFGFEIESVTTCTRITVEVRIS